LKQIILAIIEFRKSHSDGPCTGHAVVDLSLYVMPRFVVKRFTSEIFFYASKPVIKKIIGMTDFSSVLR